MRAEVIPHRTGRDPPNCSSPLLFKIMENLKCRYMHIESSK